jgi:hypothetical protein
MAGDSENSLRESMGLVCTSQNTTRRRFMSAEENKALARREIEEIWIKGNLVAAEEIERSDVGVDPAGQ